MDTSSRAWIELNHTALLNNIKQLKKITQHSALGFVVKSNAYGHGIIPVSSVLQTIPEVEWLFTFGFQEGCTLRANGITKKILALSYHDHDVREAIVHKIDIPICAPDKTLVDGINSHAQALCKRASVHLKIETGLGRLGLTEDQVMSFARYIKEQCPSIDLHGIFTHLSDAGNIDLSYSYYQLDRFNAVLKNLASHNIAIPCTHVLASGSLMLPYPKKDEYQYATVRIGGSLYGWKSELQKQRFQTIDPTIDLKPVLTWKTKVAHIARPHEGDSIGYLRTYTAHKDTKIAVLPVGYSDGYPRALSNKAQVMINGVLAPVAGIVSMNLMAIDITHVDHVTIGTEVTLIGSEKGVTVAEVAEHAGTIINELWTRLNPSVERRLIEQPISCAHDLDQKTHCQNVAT